MAHLVPVEIVFVIIFVDCTQKWGVLLNEFFEVFVKIKGLMCRDAKERGDLI